MIHLFQDCDGIGANIRRVKKQHYGIFCQLEKMSKNRYLSITERMTKLVLALSHMTNQNEQEFGVKNIPYCLTRLDYFYLLTFTTRLINLIEGGLDSQIELSRATSIADPWSNVSLDKLLALVQGIRQALDDLIPEGYTDLFKWNETRLWRVDTDCIKDEVASLEERLILVAVDHRFVQKLKQMGSVSQLLEQCPDNYCAICQEKELNEDTNFAALDCCTHLFCNSCAELWFKESK